MASAAKPQNILLAAADEASDVALLSPGAPQKNACDRSDGVVRLASWTRSIRISLRTLILILICIFAGDRTA
jgi:hypothetical protein